MEPRRVLATAAVLLTGYSGGNTETESKTGTADDSTGTGTDSYTDDSIDGTNEVARKDTEAASPVIGVILMVGIAVILASIVGAFVVGVGGDIGQNEGASVELVQYSDWFTLTVTDVGDFEDARIVGPQGQASMRLNETFEEGTKIIIYDGGFNNSDIKVSKPPSGVSPASDGDLVGGDSNNPGGEECLIRHNAKEVYGVSVDEADIGCSGQLLEDAAGGDADFAGDEIEFKLDAQYQLVISKGSSSRAKTFTIKDLK